MKLIAKAAKEVSVEIKQDQEAILKALGKSLKVIEKLYFHHWKIVTSIHYCSINTISNPKIKDQKLQKVQNKIEHQSFSDRQKFTLPNPNFHISNPNFIYDFA